MVIKTEWVIVFTKRARCMLIMISMRYIAISKYPQILLQYKCMISAFIAYIPYYIMI